MVCTRRSLMYVASVWGPTKNLATRSALLLMSAATACQAPPGQAMPPPTGDPGPGDGGGPACPPPPPGTPRQAAAAHERVNAYRRLVGLPCTTFLPEVAEAAAAHCGYFVANAGGACSDSPHLERQGCPGFAGERF